MSSDLANIFLLALVSMFNPTLMAATTIMMLMPSPKRLMLGYVLGAYTTSITAGLLVVFVLPEKSSATSTAKHPGSPLEDIVLGVLLLALAFVLRTGRDAGFQARRHTRKEQKLEAQRAAGKQTESLPLRLLGKGDPKVTFVVGALLSFPGVSYLDALDHIRKLNAGTAESVGLIIGFCLFQQIIIELPLLGYLFSPQRTQKAIAQFKDWMARRGRSAAVLGAAVLGVWLTVQGVIGLV
ncbi:MAG: GAP family protein [Solirubrobacteraceae bacterium]